MTLAQFPNIFFQFSTIGDIFYQWERLGFFDLILPFLLVVAVVFGVLTSIKIFGENKGVNIIIAIVLGLLSIRLPFFSAFLTELSPRLGIGLAILLALLILVGIFAQKKGVGVMLWILTGVGAIIFIIILTSTYNVFGGFFGYGTGVVTSDLIGYVVLIAFLIGVIVAIVVGGRDRNGQPPNDTVWAPLFGGKHHGK